MTSKLATQRQLDLWAKDLAQLEQQSKPQTIIGVFGSTGEDRSASSAKNSVRHV